MRCLIFDTWERSWNVFTSRNLNQHGLFLFLCWTTFCSPRLPSTWSHFTFVYKRSLTSPMCLPPSSKVLHRLRLSHSASRYSLWSEAVCLRNPTSFWGATLARLLASSLTWLRTDTSQWWLLPRRRRSPRRYGLRCECLFFNCDICALTPYVRDRFWNTRSSNWCVNMLILLYLLDYMSVMRTTFVCSIIVFNMFIIICLPD